MELRCPSMSNKANRTVRMMAAIETITVIHQPFRITTRESQTISQRQLYCTSQKTP
jgi:hypothetical protein